jgi:hypothetical protein
MFAAIWEAIKSVLFGKGTTQLGSANKSVSGITAGDNSGPIIVGDGNVVQLGVVAAASDILREKRRSAGR